MISALAALAGALLVAASCYSLGAVIEIHLGLGLKGTERIPLAYLLGASAMHLAIFAALAFKIAFTPVLAMVLLAAIGIGIAQGAWRRKLNGDGARTTLIRVMPTSPMGRIAAALFAAIGLAYCYLYLFNAWAPELSPDGATYHLPVVMRYLRAHGFEKITTDVYATLSEGVELLFVPAFAIGKHSSAALVHFSFLIALVWTIISYGVRIGKPLAGAAAGLLVFATPIVGVDATSAYVDLGAAAAMFAVFYLTQVWDESRNPRLWIAIGLMGGYCYAVKYTSAVILIYAAGFVLWRAKRIYPLFVMAASASVMIVPWLVKNWLYLGNPVAPFANAIFRNPYIHPSFEHFWSQYLRTYGLASLWPLPLELTVRGEALGGALGPVFLAAPIALLALRRSEGRRLLAAAALILATYFANVGTRFMIPALPFISLAMALAIEAAMPLLAILVLVHATASWPGEFHRYSNGWSLPGRIPVRAALRMIPEETFLRSKPGYALARMVEANVPQGQPVFTINGIPGSYTSREVMVGYQAAGNEVLEDILHVPADDFYQARRALVFRMPEKKLRRIRIVQTATVKNDDEQWSVHEVRFRLKGKDREPGSNWRLKAFPNEWDVGMAFDNSRVTRWRTWETTRPGNYILVDFGGDVAVDEIRVETSADSGGAKLRIEEIDAGGEAIPIAAELAELTIAEEGSLYRAAAFELRARGIEYLIVRDTDWAGKPLSEDPAKWGMRAIAREERATLYRIIEGK